MLNVCSEISFDLDGLWTDGRTYAIVKSGPERSWARCEAFNEGKDWKDRIHPDSGLEPLKFVLCSDGRVLTSVDYVQVDEDVNQEIKRQAAEDREIRAARVDLVQKLAQEWGGSDMARALFAAALWYAGGEDPGDGWFKEEGVRFWQVGRNASHSFFLGVRRDIHLLDKSKNRIRFFRGSMDEDRSSTSDGWSQSEVNTFSGYHGHG